MLMMRSHIALKDFCSWRLSHDWSTPLSQPCSHQGCSQSSRQDTLLLAGNWACHISSGKDGDTLLIQKVLHWIQQAELLEISSLTEFQHCLYTAVSIQSLKNQDARTLAAITDSFDF